jgi:hypothetical protein
MFHFCLDLEKSAHLMAVVAGEKKSFGVSWLPIYIWYCTSLFHWPVIHWQFRKLGPIQPSCAYLFATNSFHLLYSGWLDNRPPTGLGIALNFNYSAGDKRF